MNTMKLNMKAVVWSLIMGLLATPGFAAPGKNTANYLKVDVAAKAVAMGGTQFGAEDDSFAQFYNPALLSGMTQKEIGFMHNEFIDDLRQEVVAYVHPTPRHGNFAATVNYFTYGKIESFDSLGARRGDISANDIMIAGSWGRAFDFYMGERSIEKVSLGASLKALSKKLESNTGSGFAIDLGIAYPFTSKYLKGIRAGASLVNFGPGMKFKGESSPLPKTVRAGLTRSWFGDAITANLDQVVAVGEETYYALGLQYKIRKMFSLRTGYKSLSSLAHKFSYGLGFENPLFCLDYAFTPFGDLGDTHRISVCYRFGRPSKRTTADIQLHMKVDEAQALYAQGLLVDAYLLSLQIYRAAPWMDDNKNLMSKIQKDIRELEVSDKKEKVMQQVASLVARGEKFFEEGNLINAKLEFEAAVGLDPENKTAQGYLRQIDAQFKSFVESFYREGMVAMAAEDYEKAAKEFKKVLEIDPDHGQAKVQLQRCTEILDEKIKAANYAAQKDYINKMYLEGMSAFNRKAYEEAIPLFTKILEIDPTNEDARKYSDLSKESLFNMLISEGKEHLSKGNWDSAIGDLKKAVATNPQSSEAKNLLDDAQRRWELQKKVLSQNLYKQGLDAFLSGDKSKAQSAWKRAVEMDPENEEAKRGLERIR